MPIINFRVRGQKKVAFEYDAERDSVPRIGEYVVARGDDDDDHSPTIHGRVVDVEWDYGDNVAEQVVVILDGRRKRGSK